MTTLQSNQGYKGGGTGKMTVDEAIKNLDKELICRAKEECLEYECTAQCCPYFVEYVAFVESMKTVVEYYKNGGKYDT